MVGKFAPTLIGCEAKCAGKGCRVFRELDMLDQVAINLLLEAVSLLQNALVLLDAAKVPADLGAHVDLAIHRACDELQKAGVTPGDILP